MSREKSLQKAIVLSLMLTNIWCGAAYAANGADGADGANPSPKTDPISSELTAIYTDSANDGAMVVAVLLMVISPRGAAATAVMAAA